MIGYSRATDASGGFGGYSRERKLTDSDRSTESGGKAGGADTPTANADDEKIEILMVRRFNAIIRVSTNNREMTATLVEVGARKREAVRRRKRS